MKELTELAEVVNRNKVKSLHTLDSTDQDRVTEFYHMILDGEFKNDTEAANHYFKSDAHDPRYRRLKNRLKDRLWNSVVFIDVNSPRYNDAQKAFYTCQKNLVIIKTLLGRNARRAGIDLIKRTLKFSIKYEVSEVTLELYRYLRRHHASKTGNKNLYQKYSVLVDEFKTIVEAENLVLDFADHLSSLMAKRTRATKNYEEYASYAISIIKSISVDSYRFIWISKNITCNYYLHMRDYQNLIVEASYALSTLNAKGHVSDQFLGHFSLMRLIAYVQLSMAEEAESCFRECIDIYEYGSIGWYNTYDQYMLYLFRNEKYNALEGIYLTVIKEVKFQYQTQKRKETWRTYEAYMYYLSMINKVDLKRTKELPKFRISKFLNNVPNFSMDKAGYNIPILIVQILILIITKKHDLLTDRIEAIEKYATRYLRKDNNFRSNCFIKMLLQIPKRHFHAKAVDRHAAPYLKKLKTVPLQTADQSFEIEIIPYETLWQYALESLDNRSQ